MRITDRYERFLDRVGPSAAKPAEKADKAVAEGRAQPKGVLDVRVSERAQELSANAARLEELRAAVRGGTYKVDAKAIAARLVGQDDGG